MTLKKILFPIISLFLAYDAQRWFFTLLSMEPEQISFGSSFFYAFMLNIDLLGIFAIPGFVFSLFKILPRSFYSTSDSLTDSVHTLYRVFGVEYFRMLISFLFWKRGSNRTSFFDGTRAGLSEMLTSSQRAEFGHWMGLILVQIATIILLFKVYWIVAFFAFLMNILFNFYPILLQRYQRIRVERLLCRIH